MKRFLSSYRSTLILLGAVILGAAAGCIWGQRAAVVKPLGTLFLNLMLLIIVPLIFVSISLSIAKMNQPRRLGKIMGSIAAVIVLTSLLAVVLGVFITAPISLVSPADGQLIRQELELENAADPVESEELSLLERTVSALTVGDFADLLSRNNLIALVVFSILMGVSLHMAGEKAKPVVQVLDGLNEAISCFIRLVMYYAPIGLGCYMAALVGTFGSEIAVGYARTFVIYTLVAVGYFFVVYSLLAFAAGGRSGFISFWRAIAPAAVTSLATCSSAASIPVNIACAKKTGVADDVAETMIPLGTNLHKDGSIIGSVFKILFLVGLFGVQLGGGGLVKVLLVALAATLLVTAVPIGGGTISEMMILTMMGFPAAALPILTVIATIIDPPATLLNVVGNTVSTMLTARMVDGKNWNKQG